MLRSLGFGVLVCTLLCTMTSSSQAGAGGRSFKVSTNTSVDAGVAFNKSANDVLAGDVLVHTPEGDIKGTYAETQVLGFLITTVSASTATTTYIGRFDALVIDLQPTKPGTAIIYGVGLGSTGAYSFKGGAKN